MFDQMRQRSKGWVQPVERLAAFTMFERHLQLIVGLLQRLS